MNYIITGITGGLPVTIDVLDYIQQNVKIQTTQLAKSKSNSSDPFILWGCEMTITDSGISSAYVDVTEGAIWYLDEVYQVDAVSALTVANLSPTGLTTLEWDLVTAVTNAVTFKDGSSNNINLSRKATVVAPGASTWGISDLDYQGNTTWQNVVVSSGFHDHAASTATTCKFRFHDGYLEIFGDVDGRSSPWGGTSIIGIPAGYFEKLENVPNIIIFGTYLPPSPSVTSPESFVLQNYNGVGWFQTIDAGTPGDQYIWHFNNRIPYWNIP